MVNFALGFAAACAVAVTFPATTTTVLFHIAEAWHWIYDKVL